MTKKPPKIFTDAKISAIKPKARAQPVPEPASGTPTASSAPTTITEEIVVGALLAVGVSMVGSGGVWARGFGFIALIFASVNIFGGFLVTQRMLAMYQKKKK